MMRFFEKIILWFKNLFNRTKLLSENNEIEKALENEIKNISNRNENEKKEFFEKYNKIKQGKIKINELSDADIKKVNLMLEQEIKLEYENYLEIKKENQILNKEILDLQYKIYIV